MQTTEKAKIPVILDTDIGIDIDDTWALVMILNSPELDIKLITTCTGDTVYRAKIVAKLLEIAKRTDIPIGIGAPTPEGLGRENQKAWVADYNLNQYPGKIYPDGVSAIIETIMGSKEKIVLLGIGPLSNIGKALEIQPKITEHARFVGMHGSIYKGDNNKPTPDAEYNVVKRIADCQRVFTAPWEVTITPLDTCGIVKLKDEKYQKVFKSRDPLAVAIIENYRAWLEKQNNLANLSIKSSILYDTVAVYLCFSEEFLLVKEMGIRVDEKGFTVVDENARKIRCAIEWKDLNAFEDFLLERLIK